VCFIGIAPFEMIGQRLYTGRVAVAQAALSYCRKLFEVTRAYADAKPIWSPLTKPGEEMPSLSSIPQVRAQKTTVSSVLVATA